MIDFSRFANRLVMVLFKPGFGIAPVDCDSAGRISFCGPVMDYYQFEIEMDPDGLPLCTYVTISGKKAKVQINPEVVACVTVVDNLVAPKPEEGTET